MYPMRRSPRFATLQIMMVTCAALAYPSISRAAESERLMGTWRGTSVCTDRVAAPACKDETVIYDFTARAKPESVHWKADKVVEGKRLPMGEFDLVYSPSDSCWRAEITTPRVKVVWCLAVDGAALTGTAILLPGKQIVRKVEARKN